MKSASSALVSALMLGSSHASMFGAMEELHERGLKTLIEVGCFNSSTGMTKNSTWIYNTKGYCQTQCVGIDMSVQATSNSDECWCGDEIPPLISQQADNSSCDDPCAGYDLEYCGGLGFYTVYLTGTEDKSQVKYASASSSSSTTASPTATSAASVVSVNPGGKTVTVAASPETTSAPPLKISSHPSTVGIAVGLVVGVVAIAAIAGATYFIMRKRTRKAVEEEYKKNAAMSSFIGHGKPPSSSAHSFTDTRLDPVLASRRMSDGSIADNEDYSRRILKVTNA